MHPRIFVINFEEAMIQEPNAWQLDRGGSLPPTLSCFITPEQILSAKTLSTKDGIAWQHIFNKIRSNNDSVIITAYPENLSLRAESYFKIIRAYLDQHLKDSNYHLGISLDTKQGKSGYLKCLLDDIRKARPSSQIVLVDTKSTTVKKLLNATDVFISSCRYTGAHLKSLFDMLTPTPEKTAIPMLSIPSAAIFSPEDSKKSIPYAPMPKAPDMKPSPNRWRKFAGGAIAAVTAAAAATALVVTKRRGNPS